MFAIDAAFERSAIGLTFLREEDVADDYSLRCELRVRFRFKGLYAPESDNGSGLTWDGDIASIEMRSWGCKFGTDVDLYGSLGERHWRHLDDQAYEVARSFLLLHYGRQLWEQGDEDAEEAFYEEAA